MPSHDFAWSSEFERQAQRPELEFPIPSPLCPNKKGRASRHDPCSDFPKLLSPRNRGLFPKVVNSTIHSLRLQMEQIGATRATPSRSVVAKPFQFVFAGAAFHLQHPNRFPGHIVDA